MIGGENKAKKAKANLIAKSANNCLISASSSPAKVPSRIGNFAYFAKSLLLCQG